MHTCICCVLLFFFLLIFYGKVRLQCAATRPVCQRLCAGVCLFKILSGQLIGAVMVYCWQLDQMSSVSLSATKSDASMNGFLMKRCSISTSANALESGVNTCFKIHQSTRPYHLHLPSSSLSPAALLCAAPSSSMPLSSSSTASSSSTSLDPRLEEKSVSSSSSSESSLATLFRRALEMILLWLLLECLCKPYCLCWKGTDDPLQPARRLPRPSLF